MKIIYFIIIFFGVAVICGVGFNIVYAESNVNMSVSVVEQKITDTINDFDFSSFNLGNKQQIVSKAEVKGVSISKSDSWSKILSAIKYPFEQIGLFFKSVF